MASNGNRLRSFSTIDNENINHLQQRLQLVFNQIMESPIIQGGILKVKDANGNYVDTIPLTAGVGVNNIIPTGLNAIPVGWIVIDIDAESIIYKAKLPDGYDAKQFINLQCSANCNIKLYIMI